MSLVQQSRLLASSARLLPRAAAARSALASRTHGARHASFAAPRSGRRAATASRFAVLARSRARALSRKPQRRSFLGRPTSALPARRSYSTTPPSSNKPVFSSSKSTPQKEGGQTDAEFFISYFLGGSGRGKGSGHRGGRSGRNFGGGSEHDRKVFGKAKLVVGGLLAFMFLNPVRRVEAGTVGVKNFFGTVDDEVMEPGMHLVLPMTKVIPFSTRAQCLSMKSSVPSSEGLMMDVEVNLLYSIIGSEAPRLYKTVGRLDSLLGKVIEPHLSSGIRSVTSGREAKGMYAQAERDQMAKELFDYVESNLADRCVKFESVQMRRLVLPEAIQRAISQKMTAEQEAQAMTFVVERERMEATRKREEAQGIADFQRIVSEGISDQLLTWKGIEATMALANSPNAKVVVVGGGDKGLPLILGGGDK